MEDAIILIGFVVGIIGGMFVCHQWIIPSRRAQRWIWRR